MNDTAKVNKIFIKLQKAREIIKNSNLKKAGYNDYSKYNYYTPEQVDKLVFYACKEVKIIDLFNLVRNEFGMYGELKLIDLENSENTITFNQSTAIPLITATNIVQQIGGSVTYTKRYMLMTAFDIVDNNLDFDTSKKKQNNNKLDKPNIDIWLSENQFKSVKKQSKDYIKKCLQQYNGKTFEDGKTYGMKKIFKTELETLSK